MPLATLKFLRFVIPGALMFTCTAMLGAITHLWKLRLPEKADDWIYDFSIIMAGFVYYVTPAREWANRQYFDEVSENIRTKLIRAGHMPDLPEIYTWKTIRPIFFSLVDRNESLKVKAKLAYFNGLVWTSMADLRVISLVFFFISVILLLIGIKDAIISVVVFALLIGISFPFSRILTERHKKIGNEQLEIIELEYSSEIGQKLGIIRDRPHS